jgi:hypothetical protein
VSPVYDGFWLPRNLRRSLITPETSWKVEYRRFGREAVEGEPESVGVRWPLLSATQWESLFRDLEGQREIIPDDFIPRLQEALSGLISEMVGMDQSLIGAALADISSYTGYSTEMIHFALNVMDLMSFETLHKALTLHIPKDVDQRFVSLQRIGGMDGWLRHIRNRKLRWPLGMNREPISGFLPYQSNYPNTVLGYAAGNVIGTGFLIGLLAQVAALVDPGKASAHQNRIPAILIKNSREEPLFTPILLGILETMDPNLVSTVALMIWDYEDDELQDLIISKADLVLAAASDYSIHQIDQVISRANPRARFHKHGHKVSFTTVGKSYLSRGVSGGDDFPELFEILTVLSALDSIIWDQNGCLSSRIHFVEEGGEGHYSAKEYGQMLTGKLRMLAKVLPRGGIPMGRIHDRFDFFNAQTVSDQIQLCSTYEDDFIVAVDHRPWSSQQFKSMVNQCIERTIIIRPIASILEVPSIYLSWIDEKNLQTMYVAIDSEAHGSWSDEFATFVEGVAKRGVTGVRSVGQGPYPQLAYSWDGYLPQSLSITYPPGRFTTVEFENNYAQVLQNHNTVASKFF